MTLTLTPSPSLPCPACAHQVVCGIRPEIADWRVELPDLNAALTVRAEVTVDCRHFLPAISATSTVVVPLEWRQAEVAITSETAAAPAVPEAATEAQEVIPEAPAAPLSDRIERLRAAGRKGGAGRPGYDREEMFAVIRAHGTLAEAGRALGISSPTLAWRLNTLQSAGNLPADILAKRPQLAAIAEGKRGPRGVVDQERVDEIKRRVIAGEAVKVLAQQLGVSVATAFKYAKEARAAAAAPTQPAPPSAAAVPPFAPEPPDGQEILRRIVELPSAEYHPLPARPSDGFKARREQLAREAADRSWRERHPEAPIEA